MFPNKDLIVEILFREYGYYFEAHSSWDALSEHYPNSVAYCIHQPPRLLTPWIDGGVTIPVEHTQTEVYLRLIRSAAGNYLARAGRCEKCGKFWIRKAT